MNYFCGIDGGATKTTCVITDENLNVISTQKGPASSFLKDGIENVALTLAELIFNTIESSRLKLSSITGIVIGSTGAGRKADASRLSAKLKEIILSSGYEYSNIKVVSDAEIALEGAFEGKPGAILIAGTGSILLFKTRQNEIKRVGGFGRLIGDEGGGYKIGLKGLSACAKAFDLRGKTTLLTQKLKDGFNINTSQELIDFIYNKNFHIASFAPAVLSAASEGDEESRKILEEESDELIRHIKAILKISDAMPLDLVLIGSLLTEEHYYSKLFKSKATLLNNIKIKKPKHSPEIGAVLIAKKTFSQKQSGTD